MRKLLIILGTILIVTTGCGDTEYVRFEESQPINVNPKKAFKKNIQATYTNCNDTNDQLVISNKHILNLQIFKLKTHRNDIEFDSTVVIDVQNNTHLIEVLEQEGWSITIIGDTIFGSAQHSDTLFQLSNKNVLKRLKGSYFLNYKLGESNWRVKRMNLENDSLFIGEITPSDTLLKYEFITKTEEIDKVDSTKTIKYIARPSKREFKKLLKPNSFKETKCYKRN